jgi:microcystin-dependent protein
MSLYYGNGIPPGVILPFPAPLVMTPPGFLPCDGSNYDAVATPAYAGIYKKLVTDQGFVESTFTYSTTNILSLTSHGFLGGELIQVRSSGTLPTGLTQSTFYYVVFINSSTFSLSATPDQTTTLVSITAAGSGTHSLKRSLFGLGSLYDGTGSKFTVPDMRGVIPQGIGPAAGFAQTENLAIGQKYNDRSHAHYHAFNSAGAGAIGYNGAGTLTWAGGGGALSTVTGLTIAQAQTDGAAGTPRMGNTTRPKVMGLNWIIKY